MCSKSANYCFASRGAETGVLMMCEVALGAQYERLNPEYDADRRCKAANKHITWGVGSTRPDPKGAVELPGSAGLKVPMGVGRKAARDDGRGALLYNEFIVCDQAQIKQRFALQVKFRFKDYHW